MLKSFQCFQGLVFSVYRQLAFGKTAKLSSLDNPTPLLIPLDNKKRKELPTSSQTLACHIYLLRR